MTDEMEIGVADVADLVAELSDEQQAELKRIGVAWNKAKATRDKALEEAAKLPASNETEAGIKSAAIEDAKLGWAAAKEDLLERERAVRDGS